MFLAPVTPAMLPERYSDLQLIGEGVSARVYKAVDRATGSVVAIKVMNPHLQTDPISLERFKREIQITRYLNHPQIVSIYDLVTESEPIYMVMEYLGGHNLKDFIRLHAPVPPAIAVSILTQILRVLSLCHAKHVVHRDLKPQNIIVDSEHLVRLLDFGISRMTTLSDLTQTGTSLGSPEYMAPELFATNTYDPRTDIYAVGVIAFELLAGAVPFQADALAVLYHAHAECPVPRLSAARDDIPAWLQHVVERMLAKKSYERYQSVEEVLADIERQHVVARQFPRLDTRECLHCGAATIAELPLCTACGYNTFEAVKPGGCDIYISAADDRNKLHAFLQDVLGLSLPAKPSSSTLLIEGIDRFAAEVIKKSALQHAVYLNIQQRSPFRWLKRAASTVFLLLSVVALLHLVIQWHNVGAPYADIEGAVYVFVLYQVGFLVVQSWIAVKLWRKQHMRPLIADRRALSRNISFEYGWLKDLARVFKTLRTADMRGFVSLMLEKYLLLLKAPNPLSAELRCTLQEVLRVACRLAQVASELQQELNEAAILQLTREYAALPERLEREPQATRRTALLQRRSMLAACIRDFCMLEERQSGLVHKLVHLQYVFNTLVGKALVLRAALDASDAALLDDALQRLGDDAAASREIRTELERSA